MQDSREQFLGMLLGVLAASSAPAQERKELEDLATEWVEDASTGTGFRIVGRLKGKLAAYNIQSASLDSLAALALQGATGAGQAGPEPSSSSRARGQTIAEDSASSSSGSEEWQREEEGALSSSIASTVTRTVTKTGDGYKVIHRVASAYAAE
eukprot:GHVU01070511.1.p1 GENE.GHVU01070511.1~~GHVU01070511.1.p1  ORF type:complete len:153 (-),score=21.43 GHVU01070511.1:322-780(-)